MLRYIKILIRLLFYKIYFKIIAMNLFKKKKKSIRTRSPQNLSRCQKSSTQIDVHNRVKRAYSIKVISFIPQSRFQTRRRAVKRAHDAFPHLCADNRIKRRNNSNPYQSGNALNSSHNLCISINRPLSMDGKLLRG